jgi:hypothetical protein
MARGRHHRSAPTASVSRRGFITRVGATAAGAVAIGATPALGAEQAVAATPPNRFGRMFTRACRRSSPPTTGTGPPSSTSAAPAG